MRKLPGIAAALVLACPIIAESVTSTGTPGLQDDTCWKPPGGDDDESLSADVRGNSFGESELTLTDQDGNTGSVKGTPDPDGGMADSGAEFTVGDDTFRVKDGDLQRKNATGSWVDMVSADCDGDLLGGGDDLGSLPLTSTYE